MNPTFTRNIDCTYGLNISLKKRSLSLAILFALSFPSVLYAETLKTDKAKKKAKQHLLEMPVINVIGAPDKLKTLPGSAYVLEQETLYKSHVFSVSEALRKVPGVNVRDEEGFGMRPNIGIRGQNPSRSTKTLLLEDGIPLSYAPYGDNASYYHPPVERFSSIEVLKGPNQILFGPQTISGTINYITPNPPEKPGGQIAFTGGSRDFYNVNANYGGRVGDFGGLAHITHKESQGARDNTHLNINDFNVKGVYDVNAQNSLTLRANYFQEDSQVAYSGITEAEMQNFGIRYNPFKNDRMTADRYGSSLTHQLDFNDDVRLTTNVYYSQFNRDWWRQSNTTPNPTKLTDDPCGAVFAAKRLLGTAVDVDSCNSNQGRLRNYNSYGVEPRLHVNHKVLGIAGEMDAGFRAHYEEQYRVQQDGVSPTARTGIVKENNERTTDAYSGFLQNKFLLGDWSLTPGVRVEHVTFERANLLNGKGGESTLTEILPAFGTTYNPIDEVTAFFGFHGGFAPPRVEDAISNNGNAIDVGPEKSWNYELGVRTTPYTGAKFDLALFHADFSQQNAVGSIAGGGSTPIATGEALYQGLELLGRQDFGKLFNTDHNVYLQATYTWVATAEMRSPFKCLPVDGVVKGCDTNGNVKGAAMGNRLPYSPEHTLSATVGYSHPTGWDVQLETVYLGEQFSDFSQNNNTAAQIKTGQFAKIDDNVVLNFASTYHVKPINTDVFVAVKNLLDETYIVDRTRGILPGAPRLVQAGFNYKF